MLIAIDNELAAFIHQMATNQGITHERYTNRLLDDAIRREKMSRQRRERN